VARKYIGSGEEMERLQVAALKIGFEGNLEKLLNP